MFSQYNEVIFARNGVPDELMSDGALPASAEALRTFIRESGLINNVTSPHVWKTYIQFLQAPSQVNNNSRQIQIASLE